MFRNLLVMLEYEVKRNPRLAQLVGNIDAMSVDEIENTSVKLPWIRQALLALKQEHDTVVFAASLEEWIIDGHVADPIGEMRRWEGIDSFIRVGRTQLELQYGQLIWFDATGVWIDTIHSKLVDPLLSRHTVSCGQVRRSEYMDAIRARSRQLAPSGEMASLERVRFYRP